MTLASSRFMTQRGVFGRGALRYSAVVRPLLLRLLAGLLLLSWTGALAHVAQEGCGAATAGLATAPDADADDGHCAHGAVGDFAEGKFSGAAGGKVFLALPPAFALALVLSLPPSVIATGGGWAGEVSDPGGGPVGWFAGGRAAHPVRGPSDRA